MKVNEGQGPILQQADRFGKKNKSQGHESDFKKIMNQIDSQANPAEPIGSREEDIRPALNGIDIIRETGRVQAPLDVIHKKQVIGTLKETLDLVDFYSSKLADTSLRTSGLTPLIDHLEERLQMLQGMVSSPDTPEKMKPIISDLTITIGTEVERFKRGDYQ